jgi:hypothetical protein
MAKKTSTATVTIVWDCEKKPATKAKKRKKAMAKGSNRIEPFAFRDS